MNEKTKERIFKDKNEKDNIQSFHTFKDDEKLKGLSYKELIEIKPKPLEFILHPWLPTQGIAFIYAATGVGKTLFTMNIAYAIAQGGKFLKYIVTKPRKVLYIDGEMSFAQIHNRFMTIVNQQGSLYFPENFILLNPQMINRNSMPQICDLEYGQDTYLKFIEDNGIEVVVLDNLSALSSIDENNSEQWKIIQAWILKLRAKGITTIIVHHAGKNKKDYRGTSRMLDCADTAISLQDLSDGELEAEKSNSKKFKIEYQKNRCFGGRDALSFEVELDLTGWKYDSLEKNNTSRIIEMFQDLNMKPADIAIELLVSKSYVHRIIRKAKKDKLIRD